MRMEETTKREDIRDILLHSVSGVSPDHIAKRISTREDTVSDREVIEHIEHIRKSLNNESKLLTGQPPKCQECGFEDFRKVINIPSKCPKCRSRRLLQPRFKIEDSG